jgi:hypothetical protein
MSEAHFFETIRHKSDHRLPASYNREIGRVVVRWAFFEHQIQTMIWAIAFKSDPLGGALGRLSIVEQRLPKRLDLLNQLAVIRRVGFDRALWKAVRTKSGKLVDERNLLVHGCWTNHPAHGWLVREDRGSWGPSKGGPVGSRKVSPQAKPRDATKMAQTVSQLDDLIAETLALKDSLYPLPKR